LSERGILDTGPLVAYFDPRQRDHAWARDQFASMAAPVLTCEAVVAEALHLLRRTPDAQDAVLELLARGTISVAFDAAGDIGAVRQLMRRYRNVPMSFADACLVRMAEQRDDHNVCTLDGDFAIYRKHGSEPIPLLSPGAA
jgi:predicted nucleic acid-binding protein